MSVFPLLVMSFQRSRIMWALNLHSAFWAQTPTAALITVMLSSVTSSHWWGQIANETKVRAFTIISSALWTLVIFFSWGEFFIIGRQCVCVYVPFITEFVQVLLFPRRRIQYIHNSDCGISFWRKLGVATWLGQWCVPLSKLTFHGDKRNYTNLWHNFSYL